MQNPHHECCFFFLCTHLSALMHLEPGTWHSARGARDPISKQPAEDGLPLRIPEAQVQCGDGGFQLVCFNAAAKLVARALHRLEECRLQGLHWDGWLTEGPEGLVAADAEEVTGAG
jgi:hypothetical protein